MLDLRARSCARAAWSTARNATASSSPAGLCGERGVERIAHDRRRVEHEPRLVVERGELGLRARARTASGGRTCTRRLACPRELPPGRTGCHRSARRSPRRRGRRARGPRPADNGASASAVSRPSRSAPARAVATGSGSWPSRAAQREPAARRRRAAAHERGERRRRLTPGRPSAGRRAHSTSGRGPASPLEQRRAARGACACRSASSTAPRQARSASPAAVVEPATTDRSPGPTASDLELRRARRRAPGTSAPPAPPARRAAGTCRCPARPRSPRRRPCTRRARSASTRRALRNATSSAARVTDECIAHRGARIGEPT